MERNESSMNRYDKPDHYPGYPTSRLVISVDPSKSLQNIELPSGQWEYHNSPLPTLEQSLQFIEDGFETDSLGRPLHPWAHTLLSDERGVITGKGAYWHWGPNKTADPIVITSEERPRILLIERSDTGALALPGGFIDGDESGHAAALRELTEETGLEIHEPGVHVYTGPVADLRTTINAWAETSAYRFVVEGPLPVTGNDDARSAGWYFIDELPSTLFGSHAELVRKALKQPTEPLRSIEDILAVPQLERVTRPIHAGHMAYRHYVTSHANDTIFVKEHDASQFNDSAREQHSKAYLAKEHALYSHLREQSFSHIPERVTLIEDTLLAMDYLSDTEGWYWRLPSGDVSERYTSDILKAFASLQRVANLDTPEYHSDVSPTYETFWREGWDALDEHAVKRIIDKIYTLSEQWSDERRSSAIKLASSVELLQVQAAQLTRSPALYLSHNDARQSNIAWHPEHGAKIVDWSWADLGPKNADSTMFLIDLEKSGYDVSLHHDAVNTDFALQLIGFWLAHSIWETRDGSTTVREHQIASAAAAYQLLQSVK